MEIFLYICFTIAGLFFAHLLLKNKIQRELHWNNCISLGSAALILVTLAASFTPYINLLWMVIGGITCVIEYDDELEDFFSQSLCDFAFWRKK